MKTLGGTLLQAKGLGIGYMSKKGNAQKILCQNLSLSLQKGELVSLLGPNGCGKSTLIRSLAGLQPVMQGEVEIQGKQLRGTSTKALAKLISLVLTDPINMGNLTVYSLVAMGRYPYTGWFGNFSEGDRKIIDRSLEATGMESFAHKPVNEISDGERQKVMVARALAQDTPVILLDEPTAHLDLTNRVEIFQLLKRLAKAENKAILLSSHDLDLALQLSDKIWLMGRSRTFNIGTPEDLVLKGALKDVFEKGNVHFDICTGQFRAANEGHKSISIAGDPTYKLWTERAVQRCGYQVLPGAGTQITISQNGQGKIWQVESGDYRSGQLRSIEEVLTTLSQMDR